MSGGPAQRKLILCMSVSLDGSSPAATGVIDWLDASVERRVAHDDRRHRAVLELLGQTGMLVLGRRVYDDIVKAWPVTQSPMADVMNTLPKVVFSSTLTDVRWSTARVSDRPVEEEVPEPTRQPGKDIVAFGGARFARSLARHRLIDEYHLPVHPVALGDGLPLLHGLPEPAAARAGEQHRLCGRRRHPHVRRAWPRAHRAGTRARDRRPGRHAPALSRAP